MSMAEQGGSHSGPGASGRHRVRVTRRLPEGVEAHLADHYAAEFNASDAPLDRAALEQAMVQADALVPTITDRIDAALLNIPGRRVRIIANYGAGVEHIDLAAARAAGIVVTNTPGALTEATAELAILLILATSRRAMEGDRSLRAGAWPGWHPTHMIGRGLSGRTLGLVGFGRIAQATARKARALGMRIAYFSRSPATTEIERSLGAARMPSLAALAEGADVVSLHVPGGRDTHRMIDARFLTAMRPGSILINTARGSVVDEAALALALDSGKLFAAGLDVYAEEPAVHPALLRHPQIVLLPHLGSATIEARTAMGMQAIASLDAFFSMGEIPDRVA
jgi:lactate dehydrogenase-like 2-hydroxyacid dehydrogenase